MKQTRDTRKALAVFRRHGGVMSTSEALAAGVHPAALYGLLQEGRLERLARGLYRSAGAREFSNPDLAVVARKSPDAVVCLESALAFHGITTQIPRRVHVSDTATALASRWPLKRFGSRVPARSSATARSFARRSC